MAKGKPRWRSRVNQNSAKHNAQARINKGKRTVESNTIENKDEVVKRVKTRRTPKQRQEARTQKNKDRKKQVKERRQSGAKKKVSETPKSRSNRQSWRRSKPSSGPENKGSAPNRRKARADVHERLMSRQKNLETPWGRHFQKDKSTRMKLAAGIGGAVGLGMVLTDKQDDDAFSAAGKIAKIGALGIAADYGSQVALTKMGLYSSVTTGDMARVDAKTRGRKVLSVEAEKRWQRRKASQLGVAARIGMVAVGAATLMDIGHRISEDKKADLDRAEQEEQLKMKMQAERQRNHQKSYGYVDMGQIAIQQWEKRIGHYAMGNARF